MRLLTRRVWNKQLLTEADIRMAELEVERCREKLREARELGRSPSTLKDWERKVREAESTVEKVRAMVKMQREKGAAEMAEADRWWEVAKDAVCRYSRLHSCMLYGRQKHYSCYVVGGEGELREVDPDQDLLWKQRSICASGRNCRMFRPDSAENLERRNEAAVNEAWTCCTQSTGEAGEGGPKADEGCPDTSGV